MRLSRLALTTALLLGSLAGAQAQVGEVKKVAPDVYFYQGDIDGKGHCNNGWVVFEDAVLQPASDRANRVVNDTKYENRWYFVFIVFSFNLYIPRRR